MRRGVGIKGLQERKAKTENYKTKGVELESYKFEMLQERLTFFKQNLEEFASKHRKDINKDPEFRQQFTVLCQKIGVDPLASRKGFWAELLGVGDFYYELSVQIVEVCLATRAQNGGIIELNELLHRLQKKRRVSSSVSSSAASASSSSAETITENDVRQAISKLESLGTGFGVINMGENKIFVKSVPCELGGDETTLMFSTQDRQGRLGSIEEAAIRLSWSEERVQSALVALLREGFAWVDDGNEDGVQIFWFPGIIDQEKMESSG